MSPCTEKRGRKEKMYIYKVEKRFSEREGAGSEEERDAVSKTVPTKYGRSFA